MDRVFWILGYPEGCMKAEVLIAYAVLAILVSIFVNWALSIFLFTVKPFACAAIMMAFIRPDLAHNFLQEDYLMQVLDKSKHIFFGIMEVVLRLGEQFREKFN